MKPDQGGERLKRKWKLLLITPYLIMLAALLFYAIAFSGTVVLWLVIVLQLLAIEIPFMLLYTIGLVVALVIRWVILRRRRLSQVTGDNLGT